jgi:hypothetical protein
MNLRTHVGSVEQDTKKALSAVTHDLKGHLLLPCGAVCFSRAIGCHLVMCWGFGSKEVTKVRTKTW